MIKSKFLKPLNEEVLIHQIDEKFLINRGIWRNATWLHDVAYTTDGDEIAVTFTKSCRIGVNYGKTKEGKILSDKARRPSSYVRLRDDKGELVDPIYFVRDKKTETKKYLQCIYSNQKDVRKSFATRSTIVKYYKNGVEITPDEEIVKLFTSSKKKGEPSPTWVISLDKILNVK